MLKKTEEKYFHIYAPYKGCVDEEGEPTYGPRMLLGDNTFLYTAPIKLKFSDSQTTARPLTIGTGSRSIRKLNGYCVGPRTFNNASEIQYVLDVMEGKKTRKETEKVPMIIPKGISGAKKSYPMTDVLETTREHYIMKNGRALKKRNYTETKAEKEHPEILLKPDGSVFPENRWTKARFKNDAEKQECIRVLKYAKEVLDTYNTVEVESKMEALAL